MTAFDLILALLGLAGMILFNMIMVFFVKDVALSIVITVGLAMMVYDFWRQLHGRRGT